MPEIEKKKRGRKKIIKSEPEPETESEGASSSTITILQENNDTTSPVIEKKVRKRRSKKAMAEAAGISDININEC
mgnify:CR=1 FL=1